MMNIWQKQRCGSKGKRRSAPLSCLYSDVLARRLEKPNHFIAQVKLLFKWHAEYLQLPVGVKQVSENVPPSEPEGRKKVGA